jgi:hypothetical protein
LKNHGQDSASLIGVCWDESYLDPKDTTNMYEQKIVEFASHHRVLPKGYQPSQIKAIASPSRLNKPPGTPSREPHEHKQEPSVKLN